MEHPNQRSIAGPGQCVRNIPVFGPSTPLQPPEMPDYVFPTWRAALSDAQAQIGNAYEQRQRLFRAAHEAGLSYREIGEATGLSATAVGKIIGRKGKATLDDRVGR